MTILGEYISYVAGGAVENTLGSAKRTGMARMARDLMRGDAATFKAGYSAENALLAVIDRAKAEGIAITRADAGVVAQDIAALESPAVTAALAGLGVTLGWGCNRGLPEGGVSAAYGERKIAPFDRGRADWQGREDQLNELEHWLNGALENGADLPDLSVRGEGVTPGHTPIGKAREFAVTEHLGLGAHSLGARYDDVVTLYEDETGKIVGSPQGSHGYVYIAAWLKAHELAPVAA